MTIKFHLWIILKFLIAIGKDWKPRLIKYQNTLSFGLPLHELGITAVSISVDYSRDVPTKVLVMTMWLIIFKITLNQGFLFI